MRPAVAAGGFTLVELAVVLLIITFLIGGLLVPLSTQLDLRRAQETRETLANVREAILGFAAASGRLPCPASGAIGQESPTSGGSCTYFLQDGYVPGITLSLAPTDDKGFVIDAWGRRIRYAAVPVTIPDPSGAATNNPFTTANGIRTVTMGQIATYLGSNPLLSVCDTTNGGTVSTAYCGTAQVLTASAVAVLVSMGKNGNMGTLGADEAENMNNTPVFISHAQTPSTATNGEFDDLVTWLSPNVLYNRMIAAGQLP